MAAFNLHLRMEYSVCTDLSGLRLETGDWMAREAFNAFSQLTEQIFRE